MEEGLNGRTTNLDYPFPPDRNGKTYLPPCLYSHAPIDLVVLSLGGNDLQSCFNRTATNICAGLGTLVDVIQSSLYGFNMRNSPAILIISQPIVLPEVETLRDDNAQFLFENAVQKMQELVELYASLAQENGCYFLDITSDVKPSAIDGMHLDQDTVDPFV